jgi:hypothetical protein
MESTSFFSDHLDRAYIPSTTAFKPAGTAVPAGTSVNDGKRLLRCVCHRPGSNPASIPLPTLPLPKEANIIFKSTIPIQGLQSFVKVNKT